MFATCCCSAANRLPREILKSSCLVTHADSHNFTLQSFFGGKSWLRSLRLQLQRSQRHCCVAMPWPGHQSKAWTLDRTWKISKDPTISTFVWRIPCRGMFSRLHSARECETFYVSLGKQNVRRRPFVLENWDIRCARAVSANIYNTAHTISMEISSRDWILNFFCFKSVVMCHCYIALDARMASRQSCCNAWRRNYLGFKSQTFERNVNVFVFQPKFWGKTVRLSQVEATGTV